MTDGVTNGVGASAVDKQSFAEQLKQKHAARNGYGPSVEDVIDEEDIIHPLRSSGADSAPGPLLERADEILSEKAMGKQKAQEDPVGAKGSTAVKQENSLDTKSEELFPALGGGTKPRASGPVAAAWGSAKAKSVVNGNLGGVNGHGPLSSGTSTGPTTPASGIVTPVSANLSARMQPMSMPGRYSERVQFAPSQLLPRKDLKKPLQDVLRDINKRSKATVEMKPGPGGVVYFEGKGPLDAVRQALKDVAKEVGSKQSVKVPIPATVRPHIIGRQGATVQAISKRTGARIQVPKADENSLPAEDDDSSTIDVVIEGDAVAAEMARREIEAIVNDRTSTVNMRLRDIPAEFYPFIAGPHNSHVNALQEGRDIKVTVPQYYSWSHQPPPQAASAGDRPMFGPHPHSHIHIAGDRRAAQEARAEIERHVEQLRRQITLSQLAINRGQHQFIIGDRGNSLHDFLEETGCTVILPPDSDDTEMLTITGPQDRLDLGIEKIMDLATSMQMASIDIARQHNTAPIDAQNHARALTRYFQQRQAIAQLEKLYDSRIVLPTTKEGPMTWEVYSRDGKNTIRARGDIMNLINAHPPARVRQFDMDPFFHNHLEREHKHRLRSDFGVHMVLPRDGESQIVMVYEGITQSETPSELSRQRPSPSEISEFETALQKAQEHLLDFVSAHQPINVREVEVPTKLYDKVRKFVDREQQNLPPGTLPIQARPGVREGEIGRVLLRGPGDRLDNFAESISAFVEEQKKDELERGFTMQFDFPQKFANFLIGKKGENINKLREEFDVDIQVNEGKVELKGPKAKAEAAKSRITTMSKKLEDEATHVVKIEPQYHREMIGPKGSQVNRLQTRYNVRVQFPRSNHATVEDESVADGASETSGARHNRSNQAPDQVIIRGPKKGADEARDELLNLLQWTKDNSHSSIVSVAQGQLPSLIGQGGREMDTIRQLTGAKIDVPGSREAADPSSRVEVKVKGTKKQVEDARKLLEERVKVFDESVTKSLNVDKKYHKALIGSGGANIRSIVVQAGGSDDRRELARAVRFPKQDSDESTIRIEGNKAIVEKIVAAIEAFVSQRENQITEIIEVAPEKHRLLIGHGGETRRNLESQFDISIDIPKQSVQGPSRSHVKLVGPQDKVEMAKNHILELVKEQEGETIQVPRGLHHVVSDNGQIFRQLRNHHQVSVDHAGQQLPPRSSAAPRSRVSAGTALPLITDDQEAADNFSWEVVDQSTNSDEGEIPWVLRGSPDGIVKARGVIQKALNQAKQQSCIGYLILPDPKTYRFVIGPGGSQINSIRKQSGCKVNVPRDQARGEAIEIMGSRNGVEQAKSIILEAVQNGTSRSNGNREQY